MSPLGAVAPKTKKEPVLIIDKDPHRIESVGSETYIQTDGHDFYITC